MSRPTAFAIAALLLSGLARAAEPAEAERPISIAVMDFQANGASPQVASAIGGVVANELGRIGVFRITTAEAVRQLIAYERQKQLLGCGSDDCALELGGLLKVELLVSGKVTRLEATGGMPSSFTLELALLDLEKNRRISSDIQSAPSEAELMGKIGRSVIKLLGPVLSGRSGALVIASSEAGAVVKIDDVVVGTTPLEGRLTLPAGPHFVIVEKTGFVAHQQEVRVQAAQLTDVQVTLVPSPDFIRDFEASAGRMRLGGFISGGVAVAGAGVATWFALRSSQLYGTPDAANTFSFHRAKLLAGIEVEDGVDHRTAANGLRAQIESANLITAISAGVAAAGVVAAGYFFIAGEDPNRYARFRPRVTASIVPLGSDGAFVSASLSF